MYWTAASRAQKAVECSRGAGGLFTNDAVCCGPVWGHNQGEPQKAATEGRRRDASGRVARVAKVNKHTARDQENKRSEGAKHNKCYDFP